MTTINVDKERPIKFGLYAFKKFAELEGTTLDEVINKIHEFGTEKMLRLVYCGFIYGAMYYGKEIDFNEDNVWFWIDEKPELMNELADVLQKSMPAGNPQAPQKGGK